MGNKLMVIGDVGSACVCMWCVGGGELQFDILECTTLGYITHALSIEHQVLTLRTRAFRP